MPQITSDQLRDISVSVVEGFLNEKIPLSAGLAKQASYNQLNADQIQRGVEAVNTIAYLKLLGLSDDRSVEFPLCKFAEVMQQISVPVGVEEIAENESEIEKIAQVTSVAEDSALERFTGTEIIDDSDVQRKHAERMTYFTKQASINARLVEELEGRSRTVADEMMQVVNRIKKDEAGLDKLAHVTTVDEYRQLSSLVTGSVMEPRDFGEHVLFKQAQLAEVTKLASLFREAKQIVAEKAKRSELQKTAAQLHEGIVKEAMLGAAVSAAGKALGTGLGRAIGTPVKAVASVPAKMIRKSVNNSIGPAAVKIQNMAGQASSKITGKPHVPKVHTPITKGIGIGSATYAAGSVGVDAAMYSPGSNSQTGRPNDVWAALQRD